MNFYRVTVRHPMKLRRYALHVFGVMAADEATAKTKATNLYGGLEWGDTVSAEIDDTGAIRGGTSVHRLKSYTNGGRQYDR